MLRLCARCARCARSVFGSARESRVKKRFFFEAPSLLVLDFQYTGTISALNSFLKDNQMVEVGDVHTDDKAESARMDISRFLGTFDFDLFAIIPVLWYLSCSQTAIIMRNLLQVRLSRTGGGSCTVVEGHHRCHWCPYFSSIW